MKLSDMRLCFCLVTLLVTSAIGDEGDGQNAEDPSDRAAYTTTRGYAGTTSTDRYGVITSPDYPGNYPNNYRFRYDIYLGSEKSDVEINFKIFDLEYCSNCACDYILIENYKLAKPLKYCGAALPNGDGQVFLDNLDNYVWITFHSNSAQRRPGFYATYEVTQKAGNDSFLAGGSVCPPISCPYCEVGQTPEYDYTSVCPYCFCKNYQTSTYGYATTSRCPPVVCPTCPYGFHGKYHYGDGYRCTYCYCVHNQPTTTNDYRPWNNTNTNYYGKTSTYRPWNNTNTNYYGKTSTYRPWNNTNTNYYGNTTTSSYDRGCGREYFFSSTGVIMSPGAPRHHYPSNSHCEYNIDVGGVLGTIKTVALRFSFFEMENCGGCSCDSLMISSDETNGILMCDDSLVNTSRTYYVHTLSDILKLNFTTDSSVTKAGFLVYYEVTHGNSHDPCNGYCPPYYGQHVRVDYFGCCIYTDASYNYTTPGYYMTSNSGNYNQSCGPRDFYGSLGTIRSPGAPGQSYANNMDCRYDINFGGPLGSRKTVALTFNFFELEGCSNCQCDALTISSDETDHLRMCDRNLVNTSRTYYVHTSSEILKLHFTSDSSVMMPGFSVNYEVMADQVNDTCSTESCHNCNYNFLRDYFGCCICVSESYNTSSTSGYYYGSTTNGYYSKSLLLQMLTDIAHRAQILEQYAVSLEKEANDARNLVANSFG